MENLQNLVKEVDIYISQHAIFVNRLEKYIEGRTNNKPDFVDCHSCAFGKEFDKVLENLDKYPSDIKSILEDIKDTHCNFHKEALLIEDEEDLTKRKEIMEKMKDYSTHLFRKLLKLKNILKEKTK